MTLGVRKRDIVIGPCRALVLGNAFIHSFIALFNRLLIVLKITQAEGKPDFYGFYSFYLRTKQLLRPLYYSSASYTTAI